MSLSVNEVLSFAILRSGHVVAGASQLDHRVVRSVSTIEVPVEEFVREGDLVLTTAMGVGCDEARFSSFVRDIASSGAAALLIALGPHAQTIPGSVVASAEDIGMPLVEIPWQLRFSDISQAVLARLLDDQHSIVRNALDLQNRLTQLVLDGADMTSLAQALTRMLSRAVVLTDPAGKILAQGGGVWEESAMMHAIAAAASVEMGGIGPNLVYEMPQHGVALAAIDLAGETCGYIAVPVDECALTTAERLALQHATTASALCFLQQRTVEATALRLRDDFVWSLATGEITSREEALARARPLGYDLEGRYIGLFGKLHRDPHRAQRSSLSSQDRQRILHALEAIVAHDRRAVLATVVGDSVVAFIEVRRSAESIENLVARLSDRLQDRLPGTASSWGIGTLYSGFESFRRTYRDARMACLIGTRLHGEGTIMPIGQTGVYRILLDIGANAKCRSFWAGYLQTLLDYDARKGLGFFETLESYLATQGNVSETARRQQLHRQSLLNRLRRIEELTGGKLSDPHHRFALELSTRLYRMRDLVGSERERPVPARVKRRPRAKPRIPRSNGVSGPGQSSAGRSDDRACSQGESCQ